MFGLMAVQRRWEEHREAWDLIRAINAPPSGAFSYRITWNGRSLQAGDLEPVKLPPPGEARFRLPDGEYVIFRTAPTLVVR